MGATPSNTGHWIYGHHTVLAALNNPKRNVRRVLVTKRAAAKLSCQIETRLLEFVTPKETQVVIFGGDNATRQFNDLVPPGFGCSKIVSREVYTPSGNWSSFPAHKHDERILDNQGNVLEPIQEETYFYKFQKAEAYAIQQVYTKDRSLDEIVRAKDNDVVLIPKGFHPVVAAHGFHCYYLNFLAGTDQCLANTTDPDHEWIYDSWTSQDERLPLVTAEMNNYD